MHAKTYNNFDEMLADLQRDRQAADQRVESWQDLKPGDHFMRFIPSWKLVVYGEVLEPDLSDFEGIPEEEMSEDMRSEYLYERDLYKQPHMKHYRSTRCYSTACPEGELGDVHTSTVAAKLTGAQFRRAKELGWPSDSRAIYQVMELGPGPSEVV